MFRSLSTVIRRSLQILEPKVKYYYLGDLLHVTSCSLYYNTFDLLSVFGLLFISQKLQTSLWFEYTTNITWLGGEM
jgi:hypothetical protein